MLNLLEILFLQLPDHICGSNDKEQLEIIQWQIQNRINYLEKNNFTTYNDSELFRYYEIHRQIQDCIAQNPNDNIIILAIMLIVFLSITILVIYALKKVKSLQNT